MRREAKRRRAIYRAPVGLVPPGRSVPLLLSGVPLTELPVPPAPWVPVWPDFVPVPEPVVFAVGARAAQGA